MLRWLVMALWLGFCYGEKPSDNDSLQGALEAINRRQRDLADPTLYYIEHFQPPSIMYPRHNDGDGQPEDIGYGYQKSLAPKTAGVFEAIPLPEIELGSHDSGVQTHSPDGKPLENIILAYIKDNMDNTDNVNSQNHHHQNLNSDNKRSVFRERDVNVLPVSLQNLYSQDGSDQYFENGEHPISLPTSFRERFTSKPLRNNHARNMQSLVKSFGGLNRDTESFPGNDDDPDEYLSMLNSVWEKYQESNPDNFDPEELSESDVEEILDYINHKEEKKRQQDDGYQTGYDFFNSPLAWVKRDRQRLTDNTKPSSDQFLHALKFLNGHTDTLESMREEDVPDEERDSDVAKLLMEDQQKFKNNKRMKKRFWRGNTYQDYQKNIVKRYPIAKRSSSYYTSPAVLYHKTSTDAFNERKKKNVKNYVSDSGTDPKVARELNNIFSSSNNLTMAKKTLNNSEQLSQSKMFSDFTNATNTDISAINKINKSKTVFEDAMPDHVHSTHKHSKRSGQKEETSVDSQHKPQEMSKKSVKWSDYFGIDKRQKKSTNKESNDEWLLDQYLKAYSISARAINDPTISRNENTQLEVDKKSTDDMDDKLRAMEDMIVDQALKYTGAHEGMTDSEEVQAVKDRVIAQLAAAYSLEKMRKALSEFKSSIAAQKASAPVHTTTNAPTADAPEQKDKRVAVKKEKAEIPLGGKLEKKKDCCHGIGVFHHALHAHPATWNQEESCPVIGYIAQRCKEVAAWAGDSSESLTPLCIVHQVCYICGSEVVTSISGCDVSFLLEAKKVCQDTTICKDHARRTLAGIHALRGDPSPYGCNWQKHTCLAPYLGITV